MIKNDQDIYLIKKYRPFPKLDKDFVQKKYDELGDDGIVRTVIFGEQPGCWQEACELMVLSNLFLPHYDKPDCVHEFLKILLGKKLRYIDESLKAASIDLVETGGEAASNNIISLQIHEEFCLPF